MPVPSAKAIVLSSLLVLQRHDNSGGESSWFPFFANGFSAPHHFNEVHRTHHLATLSTTSSLGMARDNSRELRPQRRQPQQQQYDDDDEDDYDEDEDDMDNAIFTQNERQTSSIECPHFGTCPGCVRDHHVAEIEIIESAKLYFSSSSVQKHIAAKDRTSARYTDYDDDFYKIKVPSSITGWRTQAKLAVAQSSTWSRAAGCKIGLYQRNSHDVLSIPDCKVHHPSINRAVEVITEATKVVRSPAYTEDTGEGLLRYVQLQVELSTGKVCLSLVMNAEKFKECQPHLSYLVKELKRSDPKLWHSIWCHCNDSKGNAIFARDVTRWHPVEGPPYIREQIPGSDPEKREGLLYFSPYVFRQGNLEGFGDIAKEVWEAIPLGSKVCELYAGVGLLGLSALLHHGKEEDEEDRLGWLRCSDDNPENARCFEMAVNSMSVDITGRSPRKYDKGGRKMKGGKGKGRKYSRGGKKGQSSDNGERSIKDLMDDMMKDDRSGNNRGSPEIDASERVTYLQANAASALFKGEALGADVVIVDPPRKGLDEAVLAQLCLPYISKQPYVEKKSMLSHLPRHTIHWTNDARTLIYVSCGFDALARDLDQLLTAKNAGWELESASGYVLFPGSNHVETVVVLRR